MSSETTPVVSRAIAYFELFIINLEKLGKEHDLLKPWTDATLKWVYKYYSRMDDNNVYVITMCESIPLPPSLTEPDSNSIHSPQSHDTLSLDRRTLGG